MVVYDFPIAVLKILRDLKWQQKKSVFHVWKSDVKFLLGHNSRFSPCFWFLAVFGVAWFIDLSLQSLVLVTHGLLLYFCLVDVESVW